MRLLLLVVAWHYQLVYLLAERSPQERHDLRSRAGVLRQEAVVVTLEHTRVDRPAHRLECIGGDGIKVVELADRHAALRRVHPLHLGEAVEHRHHLRTGADAIRTEGRLCQTSDDAGTRRPTDRFGIICALVHIRERHQVIHHRGASRAPEEGHDLGAGAGLVRCKEAIADAAGDTILRRPLDGLVVIGIVWHVVEEVQNAVVLHKGYLDLYLAAGHGEGVFPVALVGELQIVAVLVGGRNGFQHIATVRRYRDGHGAALGGVLRANCHRTVLGLSGGGNGIAGRTAAAGRLPLGDYRIGLDNFFRGGVVREILAARIAVPVFDVARFAGGSRFGVHMRQLIAVPRGVYRAVFRAAGNALCLCSTGGFAAGVQVISLVLRRIILHVAILVCAGVPVMGFIGRPPGVPAVAACGNRLGFCLAALGAGKRLGARVHAGGRRGYRSGAPSMLLPGTA